MSQLIPLADHITFAMPPTLPGRMEDELAYSRVSYNDYVHTGIQQLENPDDLIRRKTLSVYEAMGHDDQVHATYTTKRYAILSPGSEVYVKGDDPHTQKILRFVNFAFDRMKGTIEQKVFEIQTAMQYGFSLSEKVWEMVNTGEWAGHVVYKDIKTRSPFGFQFLTDPHGNIPPFGLLQEPYHSYETDGLPYQKFVHWAYNSQFGNPYGQADYRPAYRPWFSKDFTIKYLNVYIERHTVPPVLFEVPDNIDKDEIERLRKFAKNWQGMSSGTVPAGVKATMPQNQWGGASSFRFQDIITLHNNAISRAMLLPDLAGFSAQSRGGTGGVGSKQIDLFFMLLRHLGQELASLIVNEQIIKPMVDLNFDNVTEYPKWRLKLITDEDPEKKARIIQMLGQVGFIGPNEKWVRPYMAFPKEALLEEPVSKDQVFTGMYRLFTEQGIKMRTMVCPFCKDPCRDSFVLDETLKSPFHRECMEYLSHTEDDAVKERTLKLVHLTEKGLQPVELWTPPHTRQVHDMQPTPVVAKMAESDDLEEPGPAEIDGGDMRSALTFAEEGIDWAKVQSKLDGFEEKANEKADQIFRQIFKSIKAQIEKLKIYQTKNFDKLDKLKIDIGPFRKLLNSVMYTSGMNGQMVALSQMHNRLKKVRKFADDPNPELDEFFFDEPEAPGDVLKEGRVFAWELDEDGKPIKAKLPDELQAFFDRRSYNTAGVEMERMRNAIINILENFIRGGDQRTAEAQIAEVFEQWYRGDRNRTRSNRTSQIIRTSMMDAFNDARSSLYEDEDVDDFVVGVQWSSILDRRTTRYCRKLDGHVFRKEQMRGMYPPAHWNCRSTTVPVLRGEKFDYSKLSLTNPGFGIRRGIGFSEDACLLDHIEEFYTEEEFLYVFGRAA